MKPIYSNMLWVPKTASFDKLRQELTVNSKYPDVPSIETYRETDDWFGIPRNYCQIPENVALEYTVGKPRAFEFKGELRQTQEQVIQQWQKMYDKGITDWILNVPTGYGKTILSIYIACQLNIPFLVIVPRETLMGQWSTFITQFSNIKNGNIGFVRQSRCEFEGKDCSIGLIQSISKDKYSEKFKKWPGLLIVDEVHNVGAATFSRIAGMFHSKFRCCLSATLDRADQMENVYYYHFGRNIITATHSNQPKPKIAIYNYKGKSHKIPYYCKNAVQQRASILSNLSVNNERTEIIAGFADQLINKGIRTLVVSDRIYQLRVLKAILNSKYGQTDLGIYISDTNDELKKHLLKNADCILATIKMVKEGIDEDTLRGLIMATPLSDVRQMVGRVTRINNSLPDPIVVDVVDYCYKNTQYWAKKRLQWYEQEGFAISEIG